MIFFRIRFSRLFRIRIRLWKSSTFYFFLIFQNYSLSSVVYLFISNPVTNPTQEKFRIRLRKSFGSDLGKFQIRFRKSLDPLMLKFSDQTESGSRSGSTTLIANKIKTGSDLKFTVDFSWHCRL